MILKICNFKYRDQKSESCKQVRYQNLAIYGNKLKMDYYYSKVAS